jgi:hypothetical protein
MARKIAGHGLGGLLYVVAVILFLLAAFGYDLEQTKVDLAWLGLAVFAAAHIA